MTEDKLQYDSNEILNFQRFLSLVILIKVILIRKESVSDNSPCLNICNQYKTT